VAGCCSYWVLKTPDFSRKNAQSAKIRLKKLRNSRENEKPPFQKPRKRPFSSCYTGGKNSAHMIKNRKNQRFCTTKLTTAAEI
jgi:hypothetical protein